MYHRANFLSNLAMTDMHLDRLKTLRNYLTTIPESALYMKAWKHNSRSCGTVHCAFGWATTIDSFAKLGLRMADSIDCTQSIIPVFEGARGYDAAAKFFGITFDQSLFLFHPRYYHVGDGDIIGVIPLADVLKRFDTIIQQGEDDYERTRQPKAVAKVHEPEYA